MNQDNYNKKVLGAIEKLSGKVGDVSEAVQDLATQMDKRFDAVDKRFDAVDKRFEAVDKRFEMADKSVDNKINNLDKKIGKLRSDLIDHVTRQVGDAKDELKKVIKTDREKHKLFDLKVLNIFERNKLIDAEEVSVLKELLA